MSRDNPFAMHRQAVWTERAVSRDDPLPLWQRVAFLAYGKHNNYGRAIFAENELYSTLKKVKARTTRSEVSNAIALAVQRNYLDATSDSRCLIVPAHAIEGGLSGNNRSVIRGVDQRKLLEN